VPKIAILKWSSVCCGGGRGENARSDECARDVDDFVFGRRSLHVYGIAKLPFWSLELWFGP
jgi:hypothetical protein